MLASGLARRSEVNTLQKLTFKVEHSLIVQLTGIVTLSSIYITPKSAFLYQSDNIKPHCLITLKDSLTSYPYLERYPVP